MDKDVFDGVAVFLEVAALSSFSQAAQRLGVSATAVSKTIRALEDRHGVLLFRRTTRRVALTEAGQQLYNRLNPAARELREALDGLGSFQSKPSGTLRLTMTRFACEWLIEPVLPEFRRKYPEILLDIHIDEGIVDLLDEGFDAGIRLGESLEKDMVALPLTPEFRWCVVASPAYAKQHGLPKQFTDIPDYTCLNYRFVTSRALHRWEFEQQGREVLVDAPVSVVVNDRSSLVNFALAGLGLAYVAEMEVQQWLATQELVSCLSDSLPVTSGLFLYFAERSQSQPKLRALIDVLKKRRGNDSSPHAVSFKAN